MPARGLPEIFAVIEDFGGVHVVRLVHLRLEEEEVLRVAHMPLQLLRHRRQRLEEPGEAALVGGGDRVGGIHHVQVHRPVVGIDDDLDRIADIVQPQLWEGPGVGERGTRGVGILHPHEPPRTDHHIGVVVQTEERGNRPHAVLDGAAHHDPAVSGDIVAE